MEQLLNALFKTKPHRRIADAVLFVLKAQLAKTRPASAP